MIAHAARWTIASQVTLALTQFAQLAVLSRLLAPTDFGVVAVAVAVTGLIALYAELGISAGIVHFQDVSDADLDRLFTINVFASLVVSILLVACSTVIANWYRREWITHALPWLALTIVFAGVSGQFRALNQKQLRFELMARIDIAASAMGALAAIVSGLLGAGAISLIYGLVVTAGISCLANIWVGMARHRPRLTRKLGGSRRFVRYGALQTAEATLNYLGSQVDVLLIGRALPSAALGIFSVDKQLCMRPAAMINPVFMRLAFPLLSLRQADIPSMRKLFLKGMGLSSALNFATYVFLAANADSIVRTLLGNGWVQASGCLRILALAYLIRSTGNPAGSLLMATGQVGRSMAWNASVLGALTIAILLGMPHGVEGVAWAIFALQALLLIPGWRLLIFPTCGASALEYFSVFLRPLAVATLALGPTLLLPPTGHTLTDLVARAIGYCAAWAVFSWYLNKEALIFIMTLAGVYQGRNAVE